MQNPKRLDSYMCFEVVEAENGFCIRVSIPDKDNLERLIVWQSDHENDMEAFAHLLEEIKNYFGPVSKSQEIYVAVGPVSTMLH